MTTSKFDEQNEQEFRQYMNNKEKGKHRLQGAGYTLGAIVVGGLLVWGGSQLGQKNCDAKTPSVVNYTNNGNMVVGSGSISTGKGKSAYSGSGKRTSSKSIDDKTVSTRVPANSMSVDEYNRIQAEQNLCNKTYMPEENMVYMFDGIGPCLYRGAGEGASLSFMYVNGYGQIDFMSRSRNVFNNLWTNRRVTPYGLMPNVREFRNMALGEYRNRQMHSKH